MVAAHVDDLLDPLTAEDLTGAERIDVMAWRLRDGRLVAALSRCCSTLGGHADGCNEGPPPEA